MSFEAGKHVQIGNPTRPEERESWELGRSILRFHYMGAVSPTLAALYDPE